MPSDRNEFFAMIHWPGASACRGLQQPLLRYEQVSSLPF
jgi:hypothetical protein